MADELGAEDVARRVFGTSFRGYEQREVRAYLGRVAAELATVEARAQLLDERLAAAEARAVPREVGEDELEAALGAEATKVLHAARSAAAEIRANAEADAARIVDDAAAALAESRQAAERDADATREQAQRDGAAAEAQGRQAVAEAHAERERILRDLARRQRAGHQQLGQLRTARDALLEALGGVQAVLDAAVSHLVAAGGDGRPAAEAARLRLPAPDAAQPTAGDGVAPGAPVPRSALRGPTVVDDDIPGAGAPGEGLVGADGPGATPEGGAVAGADGPPSDDARRGPAAGDGARAPAASRSTRGAGHRSQPVVAHTAGEGAAAGRSSPSDLAQPGVSAEVAAPRDHRPDAPAVPRRAGSSPTRLVAAGSSRPDGALADRVADGGEPAVTDGRAPGGDDIMRAEEVGADGHVVEPVAPPDATTGRSAGAPDAVDGMLARLRADRAAALERAAEVLTDLSTAQPAQAAAVVAGASADAAGHVGATGAPAGEAPPAASGPDAVAAAFARRDREVVEHERALTRALKRALADEQNRLLDALRRHRGVLPVEDLLPPVGDHGRRYAGVAEPMVVAVAAAAAASAATSGTATPLLAAAAGLGADGASRTGGPTPAGALGATGTGEVGRPWDGPLVDVRDIAAMLGREVVAGLRPRVEHALEEGAGDDEGTASEVLSAAYREWKSSRAEPAAHGAVLAAWGAGAFVTAPEGHLVWLVDPSSSCSPDCADNALAGPTPKGEPFPTGHRHPPAHPGCRCLVVPATR